MSFDCEDNNESGGIDLTILKTEAMLKLCRVLWQDFCTEMGTTPDKAGATPHLNFLAWLRQNQPLWSSEKVSEYVFKACVPVHVWDALMMVPDEVNAIAQFGVIWPQVTLAFRGLPPMEVESLHTIYLVKFRDGRMVPLSSYVPAEVGAPSATFDDGKLAVMMNVSATALRQGFESVGLKEIYENRSYECTDEAFYVLMGLVLKVLQGSAIVEQGNEQQPLRLQTGYHKACLAVKQVLQIMYEPPVPPEMRHIREKAQKRTEEIKAQQRQSRTIIKTGRSVAKSTSAPQGGWDLPNKQG